VARRAGGFNSYPASTYVVVTALPVPQLLVEIEAVAMIV